MLHGEHLCWRHECPLVSAFDRCEQCENNNYRLAGTDLSLEESVHWRLCLHVLQDLLENMRLIAGEEMWQRIDETPKQVALHRVLHSDLGFELVMGTDLESHLYPKKLVEDQPPSRRSDVLEGVR